MNRTSDEETSSSEEEEDNQEEKEDSDDEESDEDSEEVSYVVDKTVRDMDLSKEYFRSCSKEKEALKDIWNKRPVQQLSKLFASER